MREDPDAIDPTTAHMIVSAMLRVAESQDNVHLSTLRIAALRRALLALNNDVIRDVARTMEEIVARHEPE